MSEITKTFQGKAIGSKEEYWIILALLKLHKQFIYQYALFGGYVRGGFIVDFYVVTPPNNMFIEFYGGYWHEGKMGSDDTLRETIIEQRTGIPVEGIYQKDVETKEDALVAVRELLR